MNDPLELPVNFNGSEFLFPMEMIRWGYSHRFKIEVNQREYIFEPDEEGNYRIITVDQDNALNHEKELLQAIGNTLQELMG